MFPKPTLVVSKCLGFEACRYNGQALSDSFVSQLTSYVEFIPVCPEVEIGLGVPRSPIRLARVEKKLHLYQPATEQVLTDAMADFSTACLDALPQVDGFLLKNRSPSCGPSDVKVYEGLAKSANAKRGSGFFAGCAGDRFPGLPMEDEGRLKNYELREQFLIRVYSLARFRQAKKSGRMRDLVAFHSTHKLLLLAWNQTRFRACGKITANHEKRPVAAVFALYEEELKKALATRPRAPSMINTLMHAFGWVSDGLSREERAYFLESLEEYRDERIPLAALLRLIKGYAVRFDQEYLLDQVILEPFPTTLVKLSDSGKGR
ncbi:YbgA family protein [Desulfoluna spongiiphila]|uniref:Uncharacterized conserved protein YbgA, DUF1722 family n=1 Tax=Desulfoluna spongiiphila TaxID=419481 RepID=A0A1G5HI45_9BACT|nr:DUF523 and DUF1722 domain-containing protein [Desulfoluna spongiiphila]SCY63149.1 Uncharacterized conserved protein YbgA, DUF1722 family [Desulfoluna spongiiphila]